GRCKACQFADRRKIDLLRVALPPVLVPHIGNGEDGISPNGLLNPKAVLVTGWHFVLTVEAHNGRNRDHTRGRNSSATCKSANVRIGEKNIVDVQINVERTVGRGIVHVVALNSLIHGAEAAAEHSRAMPGHVEGKSYSWLEGVPSVVHQTLRNSVLSLDTDAIQVGRNPLQCRNRACAKTWAGGRNQVVVEGRTGGWG